MSTALMNPPSHADEAWKEALEVYFPEFMQFFYSDIADQIDWAAGYEMLDKELLALTTESMVGKRLVDKLIKVCRKGGQACFVLLHVEAQGDYEAEFPRRLFQYYYRLHDRYQLPILTLVILGDQGLKWRPHAYESEVFGYSVLKFQFLTHKLLDYQGREIDLLDMENPFGTVVAAHIAALSTRPDPEARYHYKFALTRRLYEKGLGRNDIQHLFHFIDGVLALPEALSMRYKENIDQLEKEQKVAYITSIEEMGIKKGLQQGLLQGGCALLRSQLEDIFGALPEPYQRQLTEADSETLRKWGKRIRKAKTLSEVFQDDQPNP